MSRSLGDLLRELEGRGLLGSVAPVAGTSPAELQLTGVVLDSRAVEPGNLFVAVPGAHVDGHDFIPAAIERGATAVLAERATAGVGVPQLVVPAARPALALAAAWFHHHPSRRLGVIGVTGTDGKTTTCYLLRAVLEAAGLACGLLSTIETIAGGKVIARSRQTTPQAPELQANLAAMVAAGDGWTVVESTSHGLAQERIGEVAYDVGVLTNLTHEHLEFHRTHEAYRAAKRRLFERLAVTDANPDKGHGKWAVVNRDDEVAVDFAAAATQAGARVVGYGVAPGADIRPLAVEEDAGGLRVTIATPRWQEQVQLRLAGRFNVHNALAAAAVGEALALDPGAVRAGLESVSGVAGRMQRVDAGQAFTLIVDYAHTADSLAKVLDNLAPLAAAGGGGLICVFGSAGERDTAKRPMMGRVAAERCRLVVLADEDPRGEDGMAILEDIAAGAEERGARRGRDLLLIPDRRAAIRAALEQARPGDVVVLCGKGHESTIEMADSVIAWDEATEALRVLTELGFA